MVSKYTVKKKGNRFTVTGPRGVWKTTYATETKARKGITSARKHWASMGKPKKKKSKSKSKSSKKKTTNKKKPKKKATKKKVNRVAKKRSWVGWARLGVYALAASQKAIRIVATDGMTALAAKKIAQNYTSTDDNGFNGNVGKDTYLPLALVAIGDAAASKAGVYRRMGSL